MNYQLLNLLEGVLNDTPKIYKNKEAVFYCPSCKLERYKKKLVINLDEGSDRFGYWRCWNCKDSNGMSGKNLVKLFYKLNVSKDKISLLYQILNSCNLLKNNFYSSIYENDNLHLNKNDVLLPSEYIPFVDVSKSKEYKNAINYLINRGVTKEDIVTYNIGYCETGKYKNRIIIPSYDSSGKLNYFIARSYYDFIKPKYMNPPMPSGNFIFFDIYINWKLPILLCEGVFDAIAAKRNAIPILGNSIPVSVKERIIKENVNEIILALDMDIIKTSLNYIEKFISEGINIKFIKMDKKDPAELGFKNFIYLYNSANYIDFKDLLYLKLKY